MPNESLCLFEMEEEGIGQQRWAVDTTLVHTAIAFAFPSLVLKQQQQQTCTVLQ